MLRNFRTYHLAVQFYRECQGLRLPRHLKDQMARASSSVVLNLAEGSGKSSPADQRRYFEIAFGSLRESQSILDLALETELAKVADTLAAHLYRLIHRSPPKKQQRSAPPHPTAGNAPISCSSCTAAQRHCS